MNIAKITPDCYVSGALSSDVTTTASTAVIAAQGARFRTYITAIGITNSHASQGTVVKILNGTTLKWRGFAYPGAGFSIQPLLRGDLNAAWSVQCETSGAAIQCSLSGFVSTE